MYDYAYLYFKSSFVSKSKRKVQFLRPVVGGRRSLENVKAGNFKVRRI